MLTARRSHHARGSQDGFTLIEVMLGVAGAMALAAGSFYLYQVTETNASVRVEQENVRTITSNAQKVYGATGSYSGATTAQAIADRVTPRSMVNGAGLLSSWDQPVLLAPVSVDGKPNAGLRVTYNAVPEEACTKFASGLADGMWDVRVGGVSVLATEGQRVIRGRVNPVLIAQRCADGAPVQITYHRLESGLVGDVLPPVDFPPPPGSTVPPAGPGVPPSAPPTAPPPPPGTPPTSPPPALPPTGTPPPPGPVAGIPPGTPPTSTPPPPTSPPPPGSPVCVVPSPSVRSCGASCADGSDGYETRINTNTFSCPAGQLISTAGASQYQATGPQTRDEERYRNENASCPDPFDSPVWDAGAWQAWSATSAWSPAYACAPICSAPPPSVSTTPQSRTAACPAGQLTPAGASSFNQDRTRTNTINYSCSTPVGPVVAAPVVYTYTPYSPSAATACDPACTAPPTSSTTENQTFSCPSGQLITTPGPAFGNSTGAQTRTATTTYSCGAPTGGYTTNPTTYSSWSPAYACSGACTAPAPTTQTQADSPETRTLACPSGQTGSITQTRPQSQNRTVSYSCPAPTGAYTTSYSPWGAPYATPPGTWSTTSNTCVTPPPSCPGPEPVSIDGWLPCPVGQVGRINRTGSSTRTATCPTSPQQWSLSPISWSVVGNTCTPVCAAPPTVVQNRTLACPPGETGAITERRSQAYTCPAPTGGYTTHPWTPWYVITDTCKPSTCTTPNYQWVAAPDPGNQPMYTHYDDRECAIDNEYNRNWPVGASTPVCNAANVNGWRIEYAIEYDDFGAGIYDCYENRYEDIRQCRDICAPTPVPPSPPPCMAPPPEERTVACPAGQTGGIIQRRTANCPASTGGFTWGSWTEVARDCRTSSAPTDGSCWATAQFDDPPRATVVANNGAAGICVFYDGGGTICYKCP